ncbi:MAG: holo-[acyl-carrier-protein] synthase [Desulfuromonadales bacterium]|nr:holo-[acyl-carrier-protein] synthase [Desulfuromonadales bacterium]
MIAGIGTDIVAIKRFQRFVDENNTPLLQRIFSEQERAYCSARKNCAASYSARFAAKEAFLKALGTGLRDGISWHDIEVTNNSLGKPELILSGKAIELFLAQGLSTVFLSLAHDGGSAIAVVVLEKP